MTVRDFNELIKKRIVKKQSPNKDRAMSLIQESDSKYDFLNITLNTIPKEKINSNVIVDHCYDILMELIRAKMYFDGYNAGNSHEAEVSYLKILEFLDADIRYMDELRYYRNGTKYYGTKLDVAYSKQTVKFMNKIRIKLKTLLA
jgi:hypothetical protein